MNSLAATLDKVEQLSSDVAGITADPQTVQNLRALIQGLSRLVDR